MKRIITLFFFLSTFLGLSQNQDTDNATRKAIDSLTIELAYQTQDSAKVDTSLKLVKALYSINDFDGALKHIIQSEKLANALNYQKGNAEITYYKALIYAEKDDYINAIDGYTRAKRLYSTLQDTLGIAKVNNSIGLIEIKRGNYNQGLRYALLALKELEDRNLRPELLIAYNNLAEAYYNIGAYEQAIEFYLKALNVQQQLNDTAGILNTNMQLGKLYAAQKDHRKAITYYEDALGQITDPNDALRGDILPLLGEEYVMLNDFTKARTHLNNGLRLNRRLKNNKGIVISLNNLAAINLKSGTNARVRLAERQLTEVQTLARNIDDDEVKLQFYKTRITLDSIRDRFKTAFYWQKQYFELKNKLDDSKVDVQPITNIDDLEDNINDNLDPTLNNSGSNENTVNTAEFDRLQLIFYALLAAFAIVSTFLVLIYLKRNSRVKYTQELESKNKKIEIQNKAILEQSKHLEDINTVKDKLFSIVSHDLKDSLSSINGFIDLLKDGSLSREEFDKLVPELSDNANNASLLLFNLLNWSKSQMQSLEPKPSYFDVQEVFETKLKLVEQKMDSKGINLIDQTLRDFVYADKSMVEIVIQNLLTNAVKFCKMGDTITISNHISNGHGIITIADTGVGISEENQAKLFKNNSFTTIGTKNEKGTGLGLSICKELVDLNNGKIWVESTPGIGSKFYVQLPKNKPNGDR